LTTVLSFYEPGKSWINCIKTASKLQKSFKTKIIAASTLPASIREGEPMIRAIEIRAPWIRPTSRAARHGLRVVGYQPVQRVVPRIEASYALIRQRALSIITACSIVWLASIWLAAAIAQAQAASKGASLTATERALMQRSIEKRQASHLLLSMVDRSDREPEALRNSAVQSSNPLPIDAQSAGEARLPSNPQGAEFASLAALASAPPSSLYYSIQAKGSGKADTSSLTNENRTLVYQLGSVSFVINRLPDSFSVSSPRNSLSDTR
jgi:hypothetical protein